MNASKVDLKGAVWQWADRIGVKVREIHLVKGGLHSMDVQFLLCLIVTWYGKVQRIVTDFWVLIWIQEICACLDFSHNAEP